VVDGHADDAVVELVALEDRRGEQGERVRASRAGDQHGSVRWQRAADLFGDELGQRAAYRHAHRGDGRVEAHAAASRPEM
jgi:hypothetical protein